MKKRITFTIFAVLMAFYCTGGIVWAAKSPATVTVDMRYHGWIDYDSDDSYDAIVSFEMTNVTESSDFTLTFKPDSQENPDGWKVVGTEFMNGEKVVAQSPCVITYKGVKESKKDILSETTLWIQQLEVTPEKFKELTENRASSWGYVDENGEDVYDNIFDYTSGKEWFDSKKSMTLQEGYYLLGYEARGDVPFGYIEVTDDGEQIPFLQDIPYNAGSKTLPTVLEEPSDWAVDELSAALAVGLVPDYITAADWQAATSRLVAAETMVLLIEKASGKAMADIAAERGWDLDTNSFSDIENDAVTFLKYAGVTTGVGENKYDPSGEYTRAQIATMIGRAAEEFFGETAKGANPFTDVPFWAAPYVGYAAENGITQGVGGGLFNSNGVLENQQTAVFFYRAYQVWD